MNFENLCRQPERHLDIEDCDFSPKDIAQEAILKTLEKLSEKGTPIANAGTTEEFIDTYKSDAGLFVSVHKYAEKEAFRERNGHENSPRKQAYLKSLIHIGEMFNEDSRLQHSDKHLEQVEYRDVLNRALKEIPPKHRADIVYFLETWHLMNEGHHVSKVALNRISRIRKRTGLPLRLPRGRPSKVSLSV